MKNMLLILGLFLFGVASAQEPATVLLVVADEGAMNDGDIAIVERLETVFGFSVDVANHETVDSTWADGMALVYVSSTVSSGSIAAKMKNVAVPVIMIEPYAQDDMGMTADSDAFRFYQAYFRDMLILDETHYLAAGLSGEVTVTEIYEIQSGQGLPNENGTVIAEFVPWADGEFLCLGAIYCYEKGAIMADTTVAAERRYFAAWNDLGAANMTAEGWTLWDAAINWCLYKDKESGVAASPAPSPEGYQLAQNYPNPFNPATTIAFTLPSQSHAQLTIYDLQGRVIATLVDAELPAGEHIFSFDAEGFPSGLYVCRLETAEGTLSKKMTLLR
ncbi:T9SS type A sorting domain-containing protein [candidate division KSB1 bacterium]|nr:T9SS type A sorting domain-containing protein [candidate division KSB1 bacterium]RQW02626.1 MAG: T9SS C-terminal target domain-containing protein [candidate division KSB1 bacterium]